VVTIEFPKKREEYCGYCESAVGIGLMAGPVIGSLIYGLVGYEYTFYCFSGIIALGLILSFFLLPNRINKVAEPKDDDSRKSGVVESQIPVTYSLFYTNRRAMFAVIASVFAMVFMIFYDSILSNRLKQLGVAENNIGKLLGFPNSL
jgi:MFS family permease